MPRAMVHPRLKRILSETSSAFSPSPTPEQASDSGKPEPESEEQDPESQEEEPDAEQAAEGRPESESSMDISDEEGGRDVAPKEDAPSPADQDAGADLASDVQPTTSITPPHAPEVEMDDNTHPHSVEEKEGDSQTVPGPSKSRSMSPHAVKDASDPPSANQSPPPQAHPPLRIKLRLGTRPSVASAPEVGESGKEVKRRKGKGRAKDTGSLTFTLPARNVPDVSEVSSRRASASRSQSFPSAESEEADDADAESEADAQIEALANPEQGDMQPMDVDTREKPVDGMESDGEVDIPEDEMDEGAEDDDEVLPGGTRSNSSAKLTARQAVLASMVGAEHVELEVPTSSRKKHLTSEEIALRREETARKRKNMSEKKLEDEKTETINRLLKKQSSRSRAKRSALLGSVVPTPQSPHSGDEGDSGEGGGEAAAGRGPTIPGPTWRWVSSRAGFRLGVPDEVEEEQSFEPVVAAPVLVVRPLAICDLPGCGETRKYRLVRDFQRGACGLEHLKVLNGPQAAV